MNGAHRLTSSGFTIRLCCASHELKCPPAMTVKTREGIPAITPAMVSESQMLGIVTTLLVNTDLICLEGLTDEEADKVSYWADWVELNGIISSSSLHMHGKVILRIVNVVFLLQPLLPLSRLDHHLISAMDT